VPGSWEGVVGANIYVYFGEAAEDVGAGGGDAGFNLDYELVEVFVDGWHPGMEWRRVEVFTAGAIGGPGLLAQSRGPPPR
jgi:hypothetical protein